MKLGFIRLFVGLLMLLKMIFWNNRTQQDFTKNRTKIHFFSHYTLISNQCDFVVRFVTKVTALTIINCSVFSKFMSFFLKTLRRCLRITLIHPLCTNVTYFTLNSENYTKKVLLILVFIKKWAFLYLYVWVFHSFYNRKFFRQKMHARFIF